LVKTDKKPLVGFFPLTYNLAETGRAILVAKRYVDLGGRVIFFSHGGKYEGLIKENNFEIKKIKPFFSEEIVKEIISVNRGEKKGQPFELSYLSESVKEEIKAYKKLNVKLIVSFLNYTSSISARAAKIPLVCVFPAPGRFHVKTPDIFNNKITRYIPDKIKIPFVNFKYFNSKKFLKNFNIVAKENNITLFRRTLDIIYGDVNIGTNFLEFINVFPNQQVFPKKNYVGIISLNELFKDRFSIKKAEKIQVKIEKHLKKPGKNILLTMGSSGDKKIFLQVISILENLNYNSIVVNSDILKKDEIPHTKKNVLILDYVPSIEDLHKRVDLSIIHGGQGTVYASVYAGKPIIGIPMNSEQHLNLEKIVGHKIGFMLSKKSFKEKTLTASLNYIFSNYDYFIKNSEKLSKSIPPHNGDINAAKILSKLISQK